jgi:uncharacterized membrane protein YeaQ/YmgE (transglycosylase-associated protein family)
MHLLWFLIVGLIAGALAKLAMPGKDPGGIGVTLLLGVAGSLLAGFATRALGISHRAGMGAGIIASAIGAFILLGIYRLIVKQRHQEQTRV